MDRGGRVRGEQVKESDNPPHSEYQIDMEKAMKPEREKRRWQRRKRRRRKWRRTRRGTGMEPKEPGDRTVERGGEGEVVWTEGEG